MATQQDRAIWPDKILKSYGFEYRNPTYGALSSRIKEAIKDTTDFYDSMHGYIFDDGVFFHPKGVTVVTFGTYPPDKFKIGEILTYVVFPATSSNKKWGVANKEIDSATKLDALLGSISHPVYGKLKDPMSKYISYDDVEESSKHVLRRIVRELRECGNSIARSELRRRLLNKSHKNKGE